MASGSVLFVTRITRARSPGASRAPVRTGSIAAASPSSPTTDDDYRARVLSGTFHEIEIHWSPDCDVSSKSLPAVPSSRIGFYDPDDVVFGDQFSNDCRTDVIVETDQQDAHASTLRISGSIENRAVRLASSGSPSTCRLNGSSDVTSNDCWLAL